MKPLIADLPRRGGEAKGAEKFFCIKNLCVFCFSARFRRPIAFALGRAGIMLNGMNYEAFFERNPAVCGGQLVVRGTRVPVRTLLASLAEGHDVNSIHAAFPSVSAEALRAVIAERDSFSSKTSAISAPLPLCG